MTAQNTYAAHLRAMIAAAPVVTPTEPAGVVAVERSTVLADALLGRPPSSPPLTWPVVADAAGHRRPVYRPLLGHAYRVAAGWSSTDIAPWLAPTPDWSPTAADGASAAAAIWTALALDDDATFARLVDAQQPSGAFLLATAADTAEVHAYHELVILHAAADRAFATGDPTLTRAVERATHFHLNETETDHATGQPWGLPAFVRVAGADPLAGAALHAVSAHQPAGPTGVALFLLADTLYGLERR